MIEWFDKSMKQVCIVRLRASAIIKRRRREEVDRTSPFALKPALVVRLPILRRRHACLLLEQPRKTLRVFKSEIVSHHCDGRIGL